jgi:hypothetical protein
VRFTEATRFQSWLAVEAALADPGGDAGPGLTAIGVALQVGLVGGEPPLLFVTTWWYENHEERAWKAFGLLAMAV